MTILQTSLKRINLVGATVTAFALFICLSAAQSINAATFTVNSTADVQDAAPGNGICATAANVCTLRAAITEANALAGDDIITLPAGTYTQSLTADTPENANASGDYDITTGITINGAGATSTFIEGNTATTERVIHFYSLTTAFNATVNDVTVRNGRTAFGAPGAGVRVERSATVAMNRVTVRDNIALGTRGGGIHVVSSNSVLTMTDCVITNNQSTNTGTEFDTTGGAGIHHASGTTTLNNSSVTSNTSTVNTTGASSLASGGGISMSVGTMNLNFSTVSNNTATSSQSGSRGGGIVSSGILNLTNSTVSNNTASVTAGTGSAIGGGIDIQGGTLTLTESTVSGNNAGEVGGIRVQSGGSAVTTANINRSAIVNNNATTGSYGGIYAVTTGGSAAIVNLTNSTVSGNSTPISGGGIGAQTTSEGDTVVQLNFSTVANNTADTDGTGGGEGGGGVVNLGQTTPGPIGASAIILKNSVIADNAAIGGVAPDIRGVITSENYNHVENLNGGTFTPGMGDVTGTDPMLGALALNGGTTANHLPNSGSPLVDQIPNGTNGCGTAPFNVDQRNAARPSPQSGACDKGSVERTFVPTATSVTVGGRVTDGNGRGLRYARVVMTDANGETKTAITNSFGHYRFVDVPAGETYVFSVSAKRYTFSQPTQVQNITEDTDDINFVADN